jgi:glucose-1-phosphate cytidylyltransferase
LENEPFFLTYGDGLSDLDVRQLLSFHRAKRNAVTLTAVQPSGNFGSVSIAPDGRVERFSEKPAGDGAWINGGFFVCEPEVFSAIPDDSSSVFERGPLEQLAEKGQLFAYKHSGYWQCMDTLRDKVLLNEQWEAGLAKWKIW